VPHVEARKSGARGGCGAIELGVVFVFEGGQLAGQVGVRREEFAETHERPHDLDVDLGGALAVQDARQHGHALLSESVRRGSAATPT
jgi:hypothetical protein